MRASRKPPWPGQGQADAYPDRLWGGRGHGPALRILLPIRMGPSPRWLQCWEESCRFFSLVMLLGKQDPCVREKQASVLMRCTIHLEELVLSVGWHGT